MKLTFLGTGTSFGIPQIGCNCKVCKSPDPRDKRNRVGAIVEMDSGTKLLIDTPPELRLQLIAAGIDRADAVLFTHDHADHTQGLDDIRAITVRQDAALNIYGPADALERIKTRFYYIFNGEPAVPGTYKPNANAYPIEAGKQVQIGDTTVVPVELPHGNMNVFGYRIGPLGYVTDAKSVPPEAMQLLSGIRVLVINALFRTDHPTHLSFPEAVRIAQELGAERTYLTHLTHHNFHADLEAELPRGIHPAFDGLTVRIDEPK